MNFKKNYPPLVAVLVFGIAASFVAGCGSSSEDGGPIVGDGGPIVGDGEWVVENRKMWDVWFDTDNGVETQQHTPLVLDLNNNKKPDATGANILGDGKIDGGILFDMDPDNVAFQLKCELAPNKCPEQDNGYWVDEDGEPNANVPASGIQKAFFGYQYLDESGNLVGLIKEDGLLHHGEQEERELTEWLAPGGGDGFLVWDYDGDGQITSAKELFGTVGLDGEQFANGFEKLSHYFNSNEDNRVDGDELEGLKIWVDDNGDGIVDEGELQSLADHGIISFDVGNYNKDTMEGSYQVEVLVER